MVIQAFIPMQAVVKGRPRRSRSGGMFTPKRTREAEDELKIHLAALEAKPLAGALNVQVTFVFKRPKKPKHPYPSRGDLDNFVKFFCDSANGILWGDDVQVTSLQACKCYGPEDGIDFKITKHSGK